MGVGGGAPNAPSPPNPPSLTEKEKAEYEALKRALQATTRKVRGF